MKITHIKTPSFHINIGQTTKFKTVKIQLTFLNDLSEENVTKRALLPYLLKAISQKYPTRKDMSIYLESMYSASFHAGVKKIGLTQEIVFDFTIIQNDYAIESDDLLEEGFEFLHEVFFKPLFTESIFEEEKRLLEEYFLSIYGNKMRFAIQGCTDNMYQGELFRLQAMGKEEDVKRITLEDCISAYHDMMTKDTISINVIGDVDIKDIESRILRHLPFESSRKDLTLIDQTEKPHREPKTITDIQDVQQGKLVLGYQFPAYYLSEDYYKAVVMNVVFGGGSESLLFRRIREELNKVYFIGSSYDQHKGSLLVYAGINPNDYDEVLQEIDSIVTSLHQETFDASMINIAKKTLVNGLIESFDSASALASRIHHLSLFDRTFNPDELIEKIENITAHDVSTISQLLKLDTVYFLRNDPDE